MKIYFSVLFLYLVHDLSGQTLSKIDNYFVDARDTVYIHSFDSSSIDSGQFIFGGVSVVKMSNDLIKIENFSNDRFTGERITFVIDQNLQVKNASYEASSDVEDNSEYYIESLLLTFNFSPFLKDVKGLQGRYSFIIKTVWTPDKSLILEGHKTETTYQAYHGKFKNGL